MVSRLGQMIKYKTNSEVLKHSLSCQLLLVMDGLESKKSMPRLMHLPHLALVLRFKAFYLLLKLLDALSEGVLHLNGRKDHVQRATAKARPWMMASAHSGTCLAALSVRIVCAVLDMLRKL